MKITACKNKISVFSFQGKVFLNLLILVIVLLLNACKKEPQPIVVDDELAATPTWNGFTLDTTISNTILGASTKAIDVDNDRHADFELQYFVAPDGTYSITLFGSGDNKVVAQSDAILKSFRSGDIINSHAQIWQTGATLIVNDGVTVKMMDDNSRGGYSIAGVYFKKNGVMHYGWLRLKFGLSRNSNIHPVILQDFAYEEAENKAIKALERTDV